MKLKGYSTGLVIDKDTKIDGLRDLVRSELGHWLKMLKDDGRVHWTHELNHCARYDEVRGCMVFDDDLSVAVHVEKLAGYIKEDYGIDIS